MNVEDLVVEQWRGPSVALESAGAAAVRRAGLAPGVRIDPSVSLRHSVEGDVRDSGQFHDRSFLHAGVVVRDDRAATPISSAQAISFRSGSGALPDDLAHRGVARDALQRDRLAGSIGPCPATPVQDEPTVADVDVDVDTDSMSMATMIGPGRDVLSGLRGTTLCRVGKVSPPKVRWSVL